MTVGAVHRAQLDELAQLFGVDAVYDDAFGRRTQAPDEALVAVLRALGAALETADDAADAVRAERDRRNRQLIEPVHVVWDGAETGLHIGAVVEGRVGLALQLEDGDVREWHADDPQGAALPAGTPFGIHRLGIEAGGERSWSTVISAPRRACEPAQGRGWGVFLPVYALRSERNWGIGDLGDARELLDTVAGMGGSLVGSTPLLAAYLDEPFEPSPYSPVSRLFWNEAFLDVPALPEYDALPLGARGDVSDISRLRDASLVDYREVAARKRATLEACASQLARMPGGRRDRFQAYLRETPRLADYARFRAAVERSGANWRTWPAVQRNGVLQDDDVDPEVVSYHAYVQWAMHEQLQALSQGAAGLYLDMPLGVHADGYDAWRDRESFAHGMSVGAPPDELAVDGQDWGLPPLHPRALRATGYAYVAACLRNLFQYARAVRIDHVMGLHRLFWIPNGMAATSGVYVRYPQDELWALVCLESHRSGAVVVGEDLGTVPPGVREAMDEHAVRRSYVMQFELAPNTHQSVNDPVASSLATINTHDTPTFAAFWNAESDDVRRSVCAHLQHRGMLAGNARDAVTVAHAAVGLLAASDADLVVVNLEDLWGETEPQNVPGTTDEHPNWRRKARLDLDQMRSDEHVQQALRQVDQLRRKASA